VSRSYRASSGLQILPKMLLPLSWISDDRFAVQDKREGTERKTYRGVVRNGTGKKKEKRKGREMV